MLGGATIEGIDRLGESLVVGKAKLIKPNREMP